MIDDDIEVAHFRATIGDVRAARERVSRALVGWGLTGLLEATMLCAGELAANAVLHGRSTFDVVLRRRGDGVRLDVIDQRPDEIPAPVPLTGTAADITLQAATGRGLQIVAAMATRWGYTTSEADKSVWVEIEPGSSGTDPEPVVVLGGPERRSPDNPHLEFRSMPVRPAVASGVQVDELVRELQLGTADPDDRALLPQLFELLDVSAPARLGGRHAALRAAARNEHRFDFVLDAPWETLAAVGALTGLLDDLADRRRGGAALGPDVVAYRAWLAEEAARQLRGATPQPCPLP